MTRLILLIILGLVAAWYFPESREVLVDATRPLATPFLRWQSQNEMREIANELQQYERSRYGQLPERRAWSNWLERSFPEQTTSDPWGSRYNLRTRRDSFFVVSPGPDRVFQTDDDLSLGRLLSTADR